MFDGVEMFEYPAVIQELTFEELLPLLDEMLDPSAYCLSVVRPLEEITNQNKGV